MGFFGIPGYSLLSSFPLVSSSKPSGRAGARKGGGGKFKLVMIQSSHRFGLAASSPNLSESSLAGWALRARVASPNGPRVSAAKPRTAAHRAKLDSDKFGDEAARPNRWLD